MYSLKVIINFVVVIQCVMEIGGMRCEDTGDQNFYGLQESTQCRILLDDLKSIKNDMEHLKTQENKIKVLPLFDIRYDNLSKKCLSGGPTFPNCGAATVCTRLSGYYHIHIKQYRNDSLLVECDAQTEGGDWTVIQRRLDGSVDFYRTWSEYKHGFGDIDGEFFIGLDKLHALTNYDGPQELLILMENGTNSAEGFAKYDAFKIGNESEKYVLKSTGRYTGTAGESLKSHIGMKFTTKDQDNDTHPGNCAEICMGAWWYTACHSSNLNAHYGDASHAKGVGWSTFSGHYNSLKYVKMMIRRRRN